MPRSPVRLVVRTLIALLALAGALCLQTAQADAALLPLIPKPPPAPVIAPVQAPVSADPAGPVRGTMILVHGGGWRGHDGPQQQDLLKNPGDLFVARGWRVVSIDYDEGQAGLDDVLDAANTELARHSSDGPVCLYGQSAGAHLALMAASRLSAIDCVIALGPPTDLYQYTVEAAPSSDPRVQLVSSQIRRLFGTTPEAVAPWNVVSLAPALQADVLLLHEASDELVPASHGQRFQAARPTTQLVELEGGDRSVPRTNFLHGTVSDAGRSQYLASMGAFADRAVVARGADRGAARSGCSQVARSVAKAGQKGLQSALRCLVRTAARKAPSGGARWRQTSVKLRGEVNAGRVWASLRATQNGQRALAAVNRRRAKVTVLSGDHSRVTVRSIRGR
jgi:acetyl esterase/lipase